VETIKIRLKNSKNTQKNIRGAKIFRGLFSRRRLGKIKYGAEVF